MVRNTDTRLQDPLVLDEIELYGELVIAASASEQPLSHPPGPTSGARCRAGRAGRRTLRAEAM